MSQNSNFTNTDNKSLEKNRKENNQNSEKEIADIKSVEENILKDLSNEGKNNIEVPSSPDRPAYENEIGLNLNNDNFNLDNKNYTKANQFSSNQIPSINSNTINMKNMYNVNYNPILNNMQSNNPINNYHGKKYYNPTGRTNYFMNLEEKKFNNIGKYNNSTEKTDLINRLLLDNREKEVADVLIEQANYNIIDVNKENRRIKKEISQNKNQITTQDVPELPYKEINSNIDMSNILGNISVRRKQKIS